MMMTCRELYGFLDEFLDGLLDAPTLQSFERHLEQCAPCRKYLASYRTTLNIARISERKDAATGTEMPEEVVQAILFARIAGSSRLPPE